MAKAEWTVRAGNTDRQTSAAQGPVPLKWASDAATRPPRYIHDPDIVSQAASAVCPGCGSKLWTVLAGEPQWLRPTAHFRHVAGSPRTACVVVSAHLAASHHLASLGYIDLPRRRVTAVSKGFSGEAYEGWVEEPAQRVQISDVRMVDSAASELTLDDGRTILVDLTNIALAWDTSCMDGVVARLKRDDAGVEEDWLRRIGPAHFSHINFRGTFRFNVERYADVLVERAAGRGVAKPSRRGTRPCA